ncbi:MAG: glucose-1-phosphate adenylyltransferase [Eubacteriales bacterium]
MYRKKECVAMLLAGGQGSRLYTLTEKTAKPAVQFGGKYRIIDFPMSNCVNSGIDTVGVLTQYQPLVLNEYIGNGQPWDLDRSSGGVMVLPPYQAKHSSDWYKGTANAIYQNLPFIELYNPDFVLILSGDHIYKMNYADMLREHKKNEADVTIAVLDVSPEEASRFGIMETDDEGRIVGFEEKPKSPRSTKASMGIYVFGYKILAEYLCRDEMNPASSNDFGKDIIPAMLKDGCRIYAYPFTGYWTDVGTIKSLWEANMDLLGSEPAFRIQDRDWRIYSRNNAAPPHFVGENARIKNSIVTEGCEIYGVVENSVLSNGVIIEECALVKDSVIMSDVIIGENSNINYSIIDSGTIIGAECVVGRPKDAAADSDITVIGSNLTIKKNSTIHAGSIISSSVL